MAQLEVYLIKVPRDEPYLGGDRSNDRIGDTDYFVNPANDVVYSFFDCSVVVKVTTDSGIVGWGECFGMVVQEAAGAIIAQLLRPMVIGRCLEERGKLYDEMYRAMRTRTPYGGFYLDALAAVDMALWDAASKALKVPIPDLLGGYRRERIPVYVSGLPAASRADRIESALEWQAKGFNAFKFSDSFTPRELVDEFATLRRALGADAEIIVDFHWRHTDAEAIRLIMQLEAYDLFFAEAPVAPESVSGLARVANSVATPLAAGEEWRTDLEFQHRFESGCLSIAQPEMGRTGITAFERICRAAAASHAKIAPHGASGIGIFLAASLQVCATLPHLLIHEYQHSIVDKNLQYVEGSLDIADGSIGVPGGPGLGLAPTQELLDASRCL